MLEKLARRAVFVLVPVTVLLLSVAPRRDEEDQEAREEAFAALLSGATLTGWFTDSNHPDAPPVHDSYTISKAAKADGDKWLIQSRIGETGLEVPLYIDVKWAGDTPVMTLDQLAVPGMGSFDARVLFYGKSYAGVWSGAKHGGEMGGRVQRPKAADGAQK